MERKQKQGPAPIQDAIQSFLREAGLYRRPQDQRVFRAWQEALGPSAGRAVPVRFSRGRLTLEVDSAVYLQELRNFTGEGLRRRVNRSLDGEPVRSLEFKLRG